ncbi:MAG: cation:proton antiporter [Deinococcales bacterium]
MSTFLEFLLMLVLIVLGAKLFGYASARIGQPMVVGEILFGLLLGPSVLNILGQPIFHHTEAIKESIKLLAELGVLLLMFMAGLETDINAMRKVGIPALNSAIGGVVVPFLGGWGLSSAIGLPLGESIFIGTILTATSVSISAQTLIEMNKLKSKEGMTILGAAVIDDVVGILILSLVIAVFATEGGAATPIWLVLVKMVAFFVLAMLLAPLLRRFVSSFGKLPISEPLLAAGVIAAALYGFGAEVLGGVAAITGSYVAGVILGTIQERHELEEKAKALVYSLFVPIFFVDIGLNANVVEALGGSLWLFGIGIVLVAIAGKVIGCGAGAYLSKFNPQESLRVGVGMVSRGEVGLIVAGIGLSRDLINQDIFSIVVLMVIASTLVTPVLLRSSFSGSATSQ